MFVEHRKSYTDDEMILRAWDREMIQDTMGRFVYYWGNGERRRALNELWVRKRQNQETASFATNIGFYVGIDEVFRHLVEEYEQRQYEVLSEFISADPETYSSRDLGMGLTDMHSSATPVLYIADDGLTARYLGYDLGMSGRGHADGTAECFHEFALFLCELIKEDGEWKLWHFVEEHDFTIPSGVDYNEIPTVITDPNDPSRKNFGDPTIRSDVYDDQFGWEYLYYDMPVPYKTYEEEEGYGPNGKVGKKYYQRHI